MLKAVSLELFGIMASETGEMTRAMMEFCDEEHEQLQYGTLRGVPTGTPCGLEVDMDLSGWFPGEVGRRRHRVTLEFLLKADQKWVRPSTF